MQRRKREKTPEQVAEERALRESLQRERPTLKKLAESGDYTVPIAQGEYWELHSAVAKLKQERERAGLSLADVALRSGIDKAAISRLENGIFENPTINTLQRYAHALGKKIIVTIADIPDVAGVDV